MSSYIDVVHPERHAPYLDIPNDVVDYLHYLDFVKLRSPRLPQTAGSPFFSAEKSAGSA